MKYGCRAHDYGCFTAQELARTLADQGYNAAQLATADLPAARRYLEEKGFAFDEDSVKRFPDGRILVIYAKQQIGGFAIHLMQK